MLKMHFLHDRYLNFSNLNLFQRKKMENDIIPEDPKGIKRCSENDEIIDVKRCKNDTQENR